MKSAHDRVVTAKGRIREIPVEQAEQATLANTRNILQAEQATMEIAQLNLAQQEARIDELLASTSWRITAACLVIRKSIFNEVGGLDEKLAFAFNDVDFCLRVHGAGYRNVWTPTAEMIHHESASRGAENTLTKQRRFFGEVALMQSRWNDLIHDDPAYSPNLSLHNGNFELAQPARVRSPI